MQFVFLIILIFPSEVTYIANNLIALDDDSKEKVYSLVEALEDLDDVQNVYNNLED